MDCEHPSHRPNISILTKSLSGDDSIRKLVTCLERRILLSSTDSSGVSLPVNPLLKSLFEALLLSNGTSAVFGAALRVGLGFETGCQTLSERSELD